MFTNLDHKTSCKIAIVLFSILVSLLIIKRITTTPPVLQEGFNTLVKKTKASEIYDDFYAEIYDQLFQSDLKNEYECVQIQKIFLKDWKGPPIKYS